MAYCTLKILFTRRKDEFASSRQTTIEPFDVSLNCHAIYAFSQNVRDRGANDKSDKANVLLNVVSSLTIIEIEFKRVRVSECKSFWRWRNDPQLVTFGIVRALVPSILQDVSSHRPNVYAAPTAQPNSSSFNESKKYRNFWKALHYWKKKKKKIAGTNS